MKSKYHNYDASIHKIVNGKIVNKSVRELIEDQKKRDQAARELSAIGIKITAFWKKLLTDGVVWCRIYPRWKTSSRLPHRFMAPLTLKSRSWSNSCNSGCVKPKNTINTMAGVALATPSRWITKVNFGWAVTPKKTWKKFKKSSLTFQRNLIRYFQLMGPEGIRLATYQLTANQESASQSMGRAWGYWWCSLGNGVPDLLKKMKTG